MTLYRTHVNLGSSVLNSAFTGGLSILALRRAEAAQKWKEIALAAEEDYKSQIRAHWNTSVSDLLSDMCTYLGGYGVNLDINEVVNTNLQDDAAADLKGKGTMSGQGSFNFDSNGQYGIVMCIFHAMPLLDYVTTGPRFGTLLTDVTQFPIPEFDKIGMEQVPVVRAINPFVGYFGTSIPSSVQNIGFLGYAPQYIDWKTSYDRSLGDFRFTLPNWIIGFDDADFFANDNADFDNNPNVDTSSSGSVSAGFFKVSPSCCDSIFTVTAGSWVNTDCLLSSNFFDIKVVRSLDTNGLPY